MNRVNPKYKAILAYIGFLTIFLGILLLLPLLVYFYQPYTSHEMRSFTVPAVLALLIGGFLWLVFRTPAPPPMTQPDAAVIVTGVWLIAVLVSALPFKLGGVLTYIDGIFEAMSGFTTTGLTMVNPDIVHPIYLLWRSIMQFVGGAGLVVIMLSAIIGALGPGMYEAEARTEHLLPHVRSTTRMIMKIYLAYYIMGVFLYLLAGMNLFDAINHSMTALATGGFSTHSRSIAYWNSPAVEAVSIFLMVIGTISFATHHVLLTNRFKKGWRDAELYMLVLLLFLGTMFAAVGFLRISGSGVLNSFRQALFQAASALTGTGFSTVDLTAIKGYTKASIIFFILTLLMIIEGGTGSTAGGIKQYRASIILHLIWWWVKKQFYPRSAVIQRTVWRRGDKLEVADSHIQAISAFIGIYLLTYTAGVIVFLLNGYGLTESMFEYASALGTVGLSVGLTNPGMPLSCKIAEILGMWLGRLEFIAIFHTFIKLIRDIRDAFTREREKIV